VREKEVWRVKRERGGFGAADGKMKALIMAHGLDCMCVCLCICAKTEKTSNSICVVCETMNVIPKMANLRESSIHAETAAVCI